MFSRKIPNFIPYNAPNTKKYIDDCISTGWIGTGKYLSLVEEKIKKLLGVEYVILVNNGTNACKLALLGSGIGLNDYVISPVFTYIATNNSILSINANPLFVDVDRDTWNINTKKVREILTDKDDIKAIMAVNLLGKSADYNEFLTLAASCKIKIIEDNCQSIFAKYKGKYTGTIGNAAAFSFFSNKIISCGEGGMVIFKNKEDYEKALLYKNQGRDYSKGRYYHNSYGENMNLTNIQAAIILAQLEDYEYIILKRDKIYKWYREFLKNIPQIELKKRDEGDVTWYVAILAVNRDELVTYMDNKGVSLNPVWKLNSEMPHLKDYSKMDYNNAKYISDKGVMLPTYVDLKKNEVEYICSLIKDFYAE